MVYSLHKQFILFAALTVFLAASNAPVYAQNNEATPIEKKLAQLEAASGGRIGVSALDTGTGKYVRYRADERFPFCSTFKAILASAVLKQSMTDPQIMDRRISYTKEDLVSWSPVTEKHVAEGMSVSELCAATLQISDNTAANLLLELMGGPEAVTTFARSIGDGAFTLNRWETELNSAIPGDIRDTTTPAAMEKSLGLLVLGDVLGPPQREQLQLWLKGNTTGAASIRAGVPQGWIVGDKTGSGSYGTTNDIAVLWPPSGAPVVLAIYFTQNEKDAPTRKDILAEVTRLVINELR